MKADSINEIIVSHAHIDHTGYLPRLVKEGFRSPIYCTQPTADLMEIMLLDSAKLQEEEASFAYSKGYSKHPNPEPLYRAQDAESVFPLIIFSGNLGRNHDIMLRPPTPIEHADILFIESTYGNKNNPALDPAANLERIKRMAL